MKPRKSLIVLIISVLMLAAAIIYFDTKLLDHVKQTSQQEDNGDKAAANDGTQVTETKEPMEEDTEGREEDVESDVPGSEDGEVRVIASESVPVSYNTPEYDIEVELCENNDMKTYIRLKYYKDGAGAENELDEEQIPELAGIFENRGDVGPESDAQQNGAAEQEAVPPENRPYSIGQALLNPVHGQLYLMVNGAQLDQYINSSFYMVDLSDVSVKKLFSYPAKYGKMYFNRDFSMLAYSFLDPPHMSIYKEESIVEVYDCVNSGFLIRGSRRTDGSTIGTNSAPGYIYDYIFEGWQSSSVIRMTRYARPADDSAAGPVQSAVFYDIAADLFLGPDGTVLPAEIIDEYSGVEESGSGDVDGSFEIGPGAGSGENGNTPDGGTQTAEEGQSRESDPVEQLRLFYRYLGSDEDYPKAMRMLDDDFILRMSLLTQFGVSEIRKEDILAEQDNAAMYAELLRGAKFSSLTNIEMPDGDTAVITYLHMIWLTEDSQFSQLMTAKMKKQGSGWVITMLEDGSQ